MAQYRRALNFDLHIESLKKYYPKKSYRQAYKDVKKFLLANGFVHRKGSGYVSEKPMKYLDLDKVLRKMWKELPWLVDCASQFDVTNVGRIYSVLPGPGNPSKGKKYLEENKSSLSDIAERTTEKAKVIKQNRVRHFNDKNKDDIDR